MTTDDERVRERFTSDREASRQHFRMNVWKETVVAYTMSSNSSAAEKGVKWADEVLAAFDRRFS